MAYTLGMPDPTVPRAAAPRTGSPLPLRLALGILLAATALAYLPALSGEFVSDDHDYVEQNPFLRRGLTASAVAEAFRSDWAGNWHPLTWLSHGLDVELFGFEPAGHHAVNVLLHLANTLLLFVLVRRLTGAPWRSFAVAALFALHPLNVESVAWISERKNLLSMLLGILCLLAFEGYARRGGALRYGLSLVAFAAGLAAKPMLVTLPAVLLLLDRWPLRRRGVARLVLEKLPFFALAAASSVVTLWAQRSFIMPLEHYPVGSRAANALISYALYLKRAFVPTGLAAVYPHAGRAIPFAAAGAALLVLAAIGAAAWRLRRTWPALGVGYLWFLGTLVPMIGVVQVTAQGMADRYAYLSHVGVFLAAAFAPVALPRPRRRLAGALGAVALLAFAAITARQCGFWRDNPTLYERALAVTGPNVQAHWACATALRRSGRADEAVLHLRRITEISPDLAEGWSALARTLGRIGRREEAVAVLGRLLAMGDPDPKALNNVAYALCEMSLPREAIPGFERAIALAPEQPGAWLNLGLALSVIGEPDRAIPRYRRAIELGTSALAEFGLASALEETGRPEEALRHYRRSLELDPSSGNPAHVGLRRLDPGSGR